MVNHKILVAGVVCLALAISMALLLGFINLNGNEALVSVARTGEVDRCLNVDAIVENTPGGGGGAFDFPAASGLDELAEQSPIILRGTIVDESGPENVDLPVRIPINAIVSTVRVEEVLKGPLLDSQITIGNMISSDDPVIPVGCEAVLFVKRVYNAPYGKDYTTINGPQGKFAIADQQVASMLRGRPDLTDQFSAMSRDQFLQDLRETIALTANE